MPNIRPEYLYLSPASPWAIPRTKPEEQFPAAFQFLTGDCNTNAGNKPERRAGRQRPPSPARKKAAARAGAGLSLASCDTAARASTSSGQEPPGPAARDRE